MNKPYLPNLTALRGIAAILVATLHFHFFLLDIIPNKNAAIINKFYLMVDLFFILSGFIMCYVYESSFEKKVTKRNYKKFLITRLARIYPLHIFTLGAYILIYLFLIAVGKFHLLSELGQHIYRLDAIPVQLAFLQTVGIYNFDTFNAPAWSLSAEWWAYVLFPFLFVLFHKIGYKRWFIISAIAIASWFTIEFILAPLEPFMNYPANPEHKTLDVNWHFGTLRGIIGFIAGMSVWQLYKKSKFKRILGNGWSLAALIIFSLLSMHFKLFDSVTVSLFAIIILSSAYGSASIDKFYSWKLLEKLGKWSFSIYMWHMVLITIVMNYFKVYLGKPVKKYLQLDYTEKWFCFIIFLIIISFVGYLSYRFLENPTRKWIKEKINTVKK